jgi:hypothetical protein
VLVWIEVTAPWIWLGPATVVDAWFGWWSYASGMFLKVRCSGPSTIVGRIWVDD